MKFRGTIGSDYSGKLGGVVASHNTYGTYFRRLVKPVNPKTPGQQNQRIAFGSTSQAWRTLSSAQQAAWITAAPSLPVLGKNGSVILTGQALFMYVNTLLQKAGVAFLVTPPTSTTAPSFTSPSIILNGSGAGHFLFSLDTWNVAGGAIDSSVSAAITAGRNYVGTYYTCATFSNPGTGAADFSTGTAYPDGASLQFAFVAETPDGRKTQQIIESATVVNTTLTAAHAGTAGAGNMTFAEAIAAQSGQVVGFDTTTSTPLTAAGNQVGATINVNETITTGDGIAEDGTVPGVKATVTPIIAT